MKNERVSLYILPLALTNFNFVGPLIRSPFLDSVGRKKMIRPLQAPPISPWVKCSHSKSEFLPSQLLRAPNPLWRSSRSALFWGHILEALLMLLGSAIELKLGVEAARQSLESVSQPLQARSHAGGVNFIGGLTLTP